MPTPTEYFKTVNRVQLKQMLDEQRAITLIDVLPPEYFEEVHIAGAVNVCVYEVDFIHHVEGLVSDKGSMIVVYCNSATSKATDVAVEKLMNAGYSNVHIYKGGTVDWRRAGNAVEGTRQQHLPTVQIENKIYSIVPEESGLQWIGRNFTGAHTGTIDILSGLIPIIRGLPNKVTFSIDMDSIKNFDIQDPTWNSILVHHLKSDDFFDVKNFPTARFDATAFVPIKDVKGNGVPNYTVTGKLTLKGVSNEITFPALIILKDDGALAAEAHFDIDRTLWKVNYGSGKFFEKLGKHLVHDFITIQFKLVAR